MGYEATIVQADAQCIVSNMSSHNERVPQRLKLSVGDIVTIEKDMKDLNLVQCSIVDKKMSDMPISFIVTRDAL